MINYNTWYDHLLWQIIFGLQEKSFFAENTRFTQRYGQNRPSNLQHAPRSFRGLSRVGFRFSRVVRLTVHVASAEDILIFFRTISKDP